MQLSPNFAFLEVHSPQLVRLGTLAERQLREDPTTCLMKLRQFGELLAQQVAAKVGIYISIGEHQYELLNRLQAKGLLSSQAGKLFHQLRQAGNDAIHQLRGDYETALSHLKYAHELAVWYYRAFGSDGNFTPSSFVIPPDTAAESEKLQLQLEQSNNDVQVALALAEAEAKRRQELEELLQETEAKFQEAVTRIEKIQADVTSQPAQQIQQTIRQAQEAEATIPNLMQILTGKIENNAASEGYESLSEKIETVTAALRDIAMLLGEHQKAPFTLESGETLLPGLGLTSDAAVITSRARDIEQGIFKLIVIGEFKHGKSTLLNAMLGSKKLPARTLATTAMITMLVYGDKDEVAIYEVNEENPRIVSWESFVKEFQLQDEDRDTLNKKKFVDRFKEIEFAQIECQHPLCKSGVRLIDSPGLAEQVSRTKLTTEFLKQAQAIIFVLNATQILSQEEREFIERHVRRGNANHIFFVGSPA